MRFGFDFDGTITKNPIVFKILIESLIKNNYDVYIISGTAESKRKNVVQELNSYGVKLEKVNLILKETESDIYSTTKWKFDHIDKLKIRCYFENRNITANDISELCTVLKVL